MVEFHGDQNCTPALIALPLRYYPDNGGVVKPSTAERWWIDVVRAMRVSLHLNPLWPI